ncbi:MAG: TIGR01777 family oxidoreductase [Dehalococcoidia bacterium]
MKVIITGGSGFIGQQLTDALLQRGHQVAILDHNPPKQNVDFFEVDLAGQEIAEELFQDVDAIIHLAGRNLFGRWNEQVRKSIYDSRILGAKSLVSSIKKLSQKPKVLISASAVGFYGDRGEEDLDESSAPGNDFLAKLCIDWEKEAREAETLGLRTVQVRTAPVLGHGGMLTQLLPLYRWGLGGPLGSGRQWFPWIHIQDIVDIYIFALENEGISGPLNACSPQHIRNKDFSDTLARVLKRPAFLGVPKWAFRLVFDGLADFVFASQKVHPNNLKEAGYSFSFPDINKALMDILA